MEFDIYIGLIILGAIIVAVGLIAKKPIGNASPLAVAGVGALLIIGGAYFGGYIDAWITPVAPVATVSGAYSFDVTASNGSYTSGTATTGSCTQTVAADKESTVVQINVDYGDDVFESNLTSFNFSIKPVAPAGADNTQLCTIYFSVDEQAKHNSEELFQESSGVMQAIWSITDSETTSNYEGSNTMLFTDTDWVELRCTLDGTGANTFGEEFDAVGESTSFDINFWSDSGWTWTYEVQLLCIKAVA